MGMRLDKPGKHRLTGQADNLCAIPYEGDDLIRDPYSHDFPTKKGYCLRPIILGIHGDDVTIGDLQIGNQSCHVFPPCRRSGLVITEFTR
jgi:hypothetical protein